MKKIFNMMIIVVIFIMSCLCVNADEELNKYLNYKIVNNEVTITHSTISGDLVIPNYIEGYPTTKIEKKAFCLNSMITSIILPDTLVIIEDSAMLSCESLNDITIPKNVQSIGLHALGYELYLYPSMHQDYVEAYKKKNDFVIKGYKGTAAETYAKQNGFKFVALDDEPQVTTATTATTQTTTTSTTVSTTSTSKATTETTKATTSTTLTTTTSATTVTTNSTTTISTSASTSASSTSGSTTNLTTPLTKASTSVTTSETTTVITNIKGDANGDNKLDVRDAAFIAQKIALDKASELPKCADFNDDGTVNVRDAAAIARYLASNVKK